MAPRKFLEETESRNSFQPDVFPPKPFSDFFKRGVAFETRTISTGHASVLSKSFRLSISARAKNLRLGYLVLPRFGLAGGSSGLQKPAAGHIRSVFSEQTCKTRFASPCFPHRRTSKILYNCRWASSSHCLSSVCTNSMDLLIPYFQLSPRNQENKS